MAKPIYLTNGMVAVVDDEDFEVLSQYKWWAEIPASGRRMYAYRQEYINGKRITIKMHRQILSPPIGKDVDHINHDGLDNRKENLRICSRSENLANGRRHSDRKYDLPKGIEYSPGRGSPFSVRVMCNGVRHWVGRFKSVDEAVVARIRKATELFGKFAH